MVRSASPCAGFRLIELSPAGMTALVRADRPGAERVVGNDINYQKRGCAG